MMNEKPYLPPLHHNHSDSAMVAMDTDDVEQQHTDDVPLATILTG